MVGRFRGVYSDARPSGRPATTGCVAAVTTASSGLPRSASGRRRPSSQGSGDHVTRIGEIVGMSPAFRPGERMWRDQSLDPPCVRKSLASGKRVPSHRSAVPCVPPPVTVMLPEVPGKREGRGGVKSLQAQRRGFIRYAQQYACYLHRPRDTKCHDPWVKPLKMLVGTTR